MGAVSITQARPSERFSRSLEDLLRVLEERPACDCGGRGKCNTSEDPYGFGYYCDCEDGFGGFHCEIKDPCGSAPCASGEICVSVAAPGIPTDDGKASGRLCFGLRAESCHFYSPKLMPR